MSSPFFVDQEGRPLVLEKQTPPNPVEEHEPSLFEIAQREAARQSTKVKETK